MRYQKYIHHWYKFISELNGARMESVKLAPDLDAIRRSYRERGYIAISLSPEIGRALMGYFDPARVLPFSVKDCVQTSMSDSHDANTVDELNRGLTFYTTPGPECTSLMTALIEKMRPIVEAAIGSHFQITNVRAWSTNPDCHRHGPTEMHVDGISEYVRKIMIYPLPPSDLNGTMEIIGRDGQHFTLSAPDNNPMALVADVGILSHRGIPPLNPSIGRPAIEVTLVPSIRTKINFSAGGQNCRIPWLRLRDLEELGDLFRNTQAEEYPWNDERRMIDAAGMSLNIGGGTCFNYPGWINVDEFSPRIPWRTSFSPTGRLPIADGQVRLVYSSHCLEHLPDATVLQLLKEAHRILMPGGELVVKLPNFDRVLAEYRAGISNNILQPDKWNVIELFQMWRRRGLSTGMTSLVSMIFCGFWNDAYGCEFSGSKAVVDSNAYHGPACITEVEADRILRSSDSPHFIAALLRSEVIRSGELVTFNHQNAWSDSEFVTVAGIAGFESIDVDDVLGVYGKRIPTLEEMVAQSKYYIFRKDLNG